MARSWISLCDEQADILVARRTMMISRRRGVRVLKNILSLQCLDSSIVIRVGSGLQRSMAGQNIRQMAHDECQQDGRSPISFYLCRELRRITTIPKVSTATATPIGPARNNIMDSSASQSCPKAINSRTPIRNAMNMDRLDTDVEECIVIVSPLAIKRVDQIS